MTDTIFAWAVAVSLGTHVLGLAAASALGYVNGTHEAPVVSVPIAVVRVEPEVPSAPPPPPPPPRRLPRKPDVVKPSRIEKPREVENLLATPSTPTLMDESPPRDTTSTSAVPEQRFLPGNSLIPRTSTVVPGPREGGEAGAGRLFATGDIPVRPGSGAAGGSGASGRGGVGLGSTGSGQQNIGGGPGGGTLTSLAHPLGGYQTSPRYPESARREGVEGITMLRFEVLTDGRVGAVK